MPYDLTEDMHASAASAPAEKMLPLDSPRESVSGMKVLLIHPLSLEIGAGGEIGSIDLARELKHQGADVRIASLNTLHGNERRISPDQLKSLLGGIPITKVEVIRILSGVVPVPSISGLANLRHEVLWADICLLTPYYFSDIAIHLLRALTRRPLVSYQSNVIERNSPGNLKDAIQDLYTSIIGVPLLLRSDLILVWNTDYRADLQQRGARRVLLLYPKVTHPEDVSQANQGKKSPEMDKLDLGEGSKLRVLVAGRMTFQKGIDVIAKVIDRLRLENNGKGGEFSFYFAGTASLPTSLIQRGNCEPSSDVRNLGVLSQSELIRFIGQVDLVWMPSRYETFGRVAMESISVGTPVLATDIPGLRDIVEPGVSGFLVRGWNPTAHLSALRTIAQMKRDRPDNWRELRRTSEARFRARFGQERESATVIDFIRLLPELARSPNFGH
jgi:glycosyltransferase involved in cell wall biosynthesis